MSAELLFWMIFLHFLGDYILQSHWMATRKLESWVAAWVHALVYGLPFAAITQHPLALAVIIGTHAVIDRYRLVRYLIWLKNQLAPKADRPAWVDCRKTGHPDSLPLWLSTWLTIIFDNAIHILINFLAVKYL